MSVLKLPCRMPGHLSFEQEYEKDMNEKFAQGTVMYLNESA